MRASQHNVALAVRYDHRFPRDKNGDRLPIVTVVTGCDVRGTEADIATVRAGLAKLQTPAPARQIEGWLAELSVITAKRTDDDFTESLRLTAYASRLSQYPADVARAALLSRTWHFWPTWAELEAICDNLAAPRRAMISALRPTETYPKTADHEGARRRVSADRAAEILREIYGEDRE